MEGNLLEEIIAVEKEVQERIEGEKMNAAAWLDGVRRETDAELARAGRELEEEGRRNVEQTVEAARGEVARLMDEVHAYCKRLEALGVEALRPLVRRRIGRVLPEDG